MSASDNCVKYSALGGGESHNFPIQFFQGLSFLHLEITLLFAKLLCYGFEEKIFFLSP